MVLDLTANGRLTVSPFVNERKALAMAAMIEGSRLGGYAGERARTDMKESLSTSDAPHAFAALVNLRNLPQYDEVVPDFQPITASETVPDFNPIQFFALKANWANLEHGKDNDGERIAPKVAELDTYQYAFGYTQVDTSLAVEKRGFKVGWSLERGVNDPFGLVSRYPADMLKVGIKTDQYVVIRALIAGVTSASNLDAGTDPITGATIPVNAPISGAALRAAIRQIGQRTDAEGNKVPVPRKFRVVVPSGTAEDVELSIALARGLATIQDGLLTYNASGLRPFDSLGRIAGVIESEFVADGFWYLVPEASSVEIPALVRVSLAGYTAPEVYVSNWNGSPIMGGASSSPFQAYSFDNDSIDLKFRQFTNAALFSEDAVVWSNGTSA
jgi:hypothetical protein